MESFLSCFACGDKSSSSVIVPEKPFTPSKSAKKTEIEVQAKEFEDDKSRVSMTTVTYLTSETAPTKGEDYDSDIRKRLQMLKTKTLVERKAMESEFVRHNMVKGRIIYLVDKRWSEEYTNFLRDPSVLQMPPINNQRLLNEQNELRKDAKERQDYFIITERVWKFVQALYGGGPAIAKDSTFPVCSLNMKKIEMPIFGMENPEYLCFINSVMQCLFSIEQINYYIFKKLFSETGSQAELKKKAFHMAFYKLIKLGLEVNSTQALEVINSKEFASLFEDKFDPSKQHDAQEFLLYFFQLLQDEMKIDAVKPPNNSNVGPDSIYALYFQQNRSIINKAFAGLQETIIVCSACDNKSVSYTPFLDLILNLSGNTLQKCIKDYFQPEKLQDCYKCEKCKKQAKATKINSISKSPNYLIVVLKKFSPITLTKIGERVSYSFELNLKKYCKGHAGEAVYNLHSLIIHKGSKSSSGHYYSFSRRSKQEWFLFNDESVKRVETKNVAGRDPYILIYQRAK